MGGTLVGRLARLGFDRLSNCAQRRYSVGMTANHSRILALFLAIAIAAVLRLVPHPPNFTPIGAMALFSGAYLGRRSIAFAAPLGAMLLSDALIGFYSGFWVTYLGVAAIVLIGWLVLSRLSVVRLGVAAIASSVIFFLVSNFGTWALSGMYPHNAAGLAACYIAAIPFFQNTVAGDLFYTTLLFGGFKLAELLVPRLRAGGPQPA
jgi:uncharacterized membrane protein (Fun14 family)